ncbi:MAG: NFACT RNA binding domain-containing protein [Calditrichaceae bacterium]
MHKNYFLFEAQVRELKKQLQNIIISEIFTYRKNEIVFVVNAPEVKHLKVNISSDYPYLLLKNSEKVRLPKFQLFDFLIGTSIKGIEIFPFDKLIQFHLEQYIIEIRFFGQQNIFIKNASGEIVDTFKENRAEISETELSHLLDFRSVTLTELEKLFQNEDQQKLNYFLRRHFGAINELMSKEIFFRSNLQKHERLESLSKDNISALYNAFRNIAEEMASVDTCYLYRKNDNTVNISIIRLHHLEQSDSAGYDVFPGINETWIRFIEEKTEKTEFDRLYKKCRNAIDDRKKFITRTLKNIEMAENLSERKTEAELKGNLLLTFKHHVPRNSSNVELENIFSSERETVTIKLNPNKTTVENANYYFNKYKDIAKKQLVMDIKKDSYINELEKVNKLSEILDQTNKLTKLKNLENSLMDMKLLQRTSVTKESRQSLTYSFNRMVLDKEWDIFIGKNGDNNDLLTFTFANKWDIWLHAQSVPGSHVIIHLPSRTKLPPAKVIEQAAQIAAANSRSKHSTTVPVIYTEARYVHRIRKAPAGTVSVQNEKVVFVKPLVIN